MCFFRHLPTFHGNLFARLSNWTQLIFDQSSVYHSKFIEFVFFPDVQWDWFGGGRTQTRGQSHRSGEKIKNCPQQSPQQHRLGPINSGNHIGRPSKRTKERKRNSQGKCLHSHLHNWRRSFQQQRKFEGTCAMSPFCTSSVMCSYFKISFEWKFSCFEVQIIRHSFLSLMLLVLTFWFGFTVRK